MSRVKISLDHKRIRRLIWLVLTVSVLLSCSLQSVAGIAYYSLVMQNDAAVGSPPIILQNGTAGTSIIYTNSTSAKVNVTATVETYDYVLKVVNQIPDNLTVNLQVYNSSNIDRLSSLKISLHDGTSSNQIAASGGNITQSEGPPYNLAENATIYISMSNLQASTVGTSYLYVYLKILVPDTSTYLLYIITFEIT